MGSFPSPCDPPLPSAPLHRRSANRAPSKPGLDLGGIDLPSLLSHPPSFFHRRHLRRRPSPRIIQGHHRPKTFVGSISAHEIAADSLASSGNGAVDTGAPPGSAFRPPFVHSIAHHWRLRFSPSLSFVGPFPSPSCHRSAAATGNPGFTADSGVIATAGADQLSLPPQAAVNYFSPSTTTISAAASPSTPQIELNSPPRTLPAPSTTIFYGRQRLQQRPYRPRNHTVTGSHSGRRNTVIPDHLSRLSGHRPSPALLPHPPRIPRRHRLGLKRLTAPFQDHL